MLFRNISVDKIEIIFHVDIYCYQKDQRVDVNLTYFSQEERKFRILECILIRQ